MRLLLPALILTMTFAAAPHAHQMFQNVWHNAEVPEDVPQEDEPIVDQTDDDFASADDVDPETDFDSSPWFDLHSWLEFCRAVLMIWAHMPDKW